MMLSWSSITAMKNRVKQSILGRVKIMQGKCEKLV
jgi:hypothetical protein